MKYIPAALTLTDGWTSPIVTAKSYIIAWFSSAREIVHVKVMLAIEASDFIVKSSSV